MQQRRALAALHKGKQRQQRQQEGEQVARLGLK
jgi:hypothetical protein